METWGEVCCTSTTMSMYALLTPEVMACGTVTAVLVEGEEAVTMAAPFAADMRRVDKGDEQQEAEEQLLPPVQQHGPDKRPVIPSCNAKAGDRNQTDEESEEPEPHAAPSQEEVLDEADDPPLRYTGFSDMRCATDRRVARLRTWNSVCGFSSRIGGVWGREEGWIYLCM